MEEIHIPLSCFYGNYSLDTPSHTHRANVTDVTELLLCQPVSLRDIFCSSVENIARFSPCFAKDSTN